MNIGVKEVCLADIQKQAEDNFRGGFFCCEALMRAIKDGFQLDVPDDVIAMSSGMSVGVGRSGCLCGALNGGIMALGMFFGRTEPKGPQDPKVVKVMGYTHELHDWFKVHNKKNATCCRVLTREFDMGKGEHKEQCIWFTGLCAWKVAEIVCRDLGIKFTDDPAQVEEMAKAA
ncbi:MAG: C_GCAxxG_C_C family protein [Lachnospiraceae bacterium]|nr:C_GCAxxG_C_C family protein [Lachnospiraceae bacterium]